MCTIVIYKRKGLIIKSIYLLYRKVINSAKILFKNVLRIKIIYNSMTVTIYKFKVNRVAKFITQAEETYSISLKIVNEISKNHFHKRG